MDSLLSKKVPGPEGWEATFFPSRWLNPLRDCWHLKCFPHPLTRGQQCPSPHPGENRDRERQGRRVSRLWTLDILGYFDMPRRHTHTHRADLNIPGNAPGWKREWEACWGPAWLLCAIIWNNCQFRPFNAPLKHAFTGRAFEGHLAHIFSFPPSRTHRTSLGYIHAFW